MPDMGLESQGERQETVTTGLWEPAFAQNRVGQDPSTPKARGRCRTDRGRENGREEELPVRVKERMATRVP